MSEETIKVRVAVVLGPSGSWAAVGGDSPTEIGWRDTLDEAWEDEPGQKGYWLVATLPKPAKVPEPVEVAAEVEEAKP